MKLKKFSIRGFRSLKDVTWEPGDLNVLIGPNGSGKSNFLRGLELLQQAATGDFDAAIVRQGGIGSILWDNQFGQLGWKLSTDNFTYELVLQPYRLRGYRIEREIFQGYSWTE